MPGQRIHGSTRKGWTALLLLAALLLPGHAGARWVDLGGGGLEVRLLDSDGARSVIEISLGGFEATPVAIDGETYYRITLEGATVQEEPGFPALPDVRRSVIVPDDQDVAVRLLAAEHVDVPATPVAPSKGHLPRSIDPATVPYVFDAFYGTGGVYPPALVSAEDPYILRDLRGVVIDANVFQYLPSSRTLRVYTRLLLEVAPSGPATINPLQRAEPLGRMDPQFAALYGRHFLNFGGGTRYTPVLEEGGLLIITYDSFRPAVEPLHRWKLQKGMPSKLVDLSTVGSTSAQIKAYIENEYHTSGIAYVLLVGDAAQVPTIAYRNGSDPSYSLITPDNYPDLFVGRFSAETLAQAATQVERTIAYERDAAAGESWPQWGMGIASSGGADRGHYGESDILHGELIRADLLAYGYTAVDRLYAPEAMAVQVTSALNAGRGIVNYTGHGSETAWSTTGFSNSHVAALTNDNMLPFICSVACMNGNFTNGNCFAEAWLRSTHDGQPVGAVAAYMSTINQSWAPPMDAQDEVVDLLVADRMRTIGGLFFNGSCLMIERNDTTGVKEFKCWTIFGDPSLIVRTREVEPMSAAHTGVLRLGQDSFALIVPGVPGALCALYADGVLYGSAFTDPSGAATITIAQPPLEPMTLLLTVTAFNRETLVEDIAVVPVSGAHLTIRAVEYLDGSGDGILNAGETVQMRLQLENVGDSTATGVSALIGSASGELTILAGSRTFPDIAPADTAWSDSAFVLAIASNCPDQRVVTIPLSFSGGERSLGQGLVGFAVQAPDIVIAEVQVDDTLGGNGNMRLDPGETAAIRISLANRGHYPLTDLAGLLTCDDSQVQVLEGSGSHPGLARGASGVLSPDFVVAVDAGFALTDAICRIALSGSHGYETLLSLRLPVGGFHEPVESGSPGWTHAVVRPEFADQWHISSARNRTPGGSHSWKCGDAGGEAYAHGLDAGLLSPFLELDGTGELRFWHWIDAETDPGDPERAFDGGLVEISIDGGPFTPITPVGGYPYRIRAGAGGPLAEGTPVFSGTNDWRPATFDLQGIVGGVVLRWRFGSDGEGAQEGWYIDDVEVLGLNAYSKVALLDSPPARLSLAPCRPNPVAERARIAFALPQAGPVTLQVFDAAGRIVRTLVRESLPAGFHSAQWPGDTDGGAAAASGLYYYRLRTDEGTLSRSLVLMR